MITKDILNIYIKYNGDSDGIDKIGNSEEKFLLNGKTWKLIEELIQDILLINKGLVSEEFKNKIEEKIKNACDNNQTIEFLYRIALFR